MSYRLVFLGGGLKHDQLITVEKGREYTSFIKCVNDQISQMRGDANLMITFIMCRKRQKSYAIFKDELIQRYSRNKLLTNIQQT